jgi:hypothetical protein
LLAFFFAVFFFRPLLQVIYVITRPMMVKHPAPTADPIAILLSLVRPPPEGLEVPLFVVDEQLSPLSVPPPSPFPLQGPELFPSLLPLPPEEVAVVEAAVLVTVTVSTDDYCQLQHNR